MIGSRLNKRGLRDLIVASSIACKNDFLDGLHAMTYASMRDIYRKLLTLDVLSLTSIDKCLELGCGRPYFAYFLELVGLEVEAIDFPKGIGTAYFDETSLLILFFNQECACACNATCNN